MSEQDKKSEVDSQPAEISADEIQKSLEALRSGTADTGDQTEVQKIVEKEDPGKRSLNSFWARIVLGLLVFMSGFYIYTAGTFPAPVQWQRGLYVLITYILILVLYPAFPRSGRAYRWFQAKHAERWQASSASGPMRLVRAIIAPSRGPGLVDLLLIGLTIVAVGYYIVNFRALQFRGGAYSQTDYMIAVIGLLLSLEVSRRVLGWSMTIIGIVFLLYMHYGYVLYDTILEAFAHRGQAFNRVATILYFDQEGVFGVMANVLVSSVILFIFFGAFLRKSGASRFFIDLPFALAGRSTGGPAKVAVFSSALFGSISGSAIANTVSTGTFTIPLMKKAGFKPHVAGAIEPAASIGGMFMPPVMGAGAFLMAELTGTPYSTIVLVSIFPAILYFTSVLTMVHFEAKKQGLVGIDAGMRARDILRHDWYMALPLVVIVVLMVAGFSPGYAAFWSIISCVILMYTLPDILPDFRISAHISVPIVLFVVLLVVSYSQVINLFIGGLLTGGMFEERFGVSLSRAFASAKPFWPFGENTPPILAVFFWTLIAAGVGFIFTRRQVGSGAERLAAARRSTANVLRKTVDAMAEGARDTLVIGATVGVIGIIVGTIHATGVGLRFSDIIVSLSNGNTLLAIFLIGLASLVLGMGVPVTASYLVVAVLAVPALQDLGVALIAAHMIVYWFSQDSNITPPVCVAAYAGAAIAGSDPWKTGWTAFKFAKLLYVMPILFAFSPAILLIGEGGADGQVLTNLAAYDVVLAYSSAFIGTIAFSAVTMGYLVRKTTWWEWLIFAFGTFLCFFPNIQSDILGLAIIGAVWFWQRYDVRRRARLAESSITQAVS